MKLRALSANALKILAITLMTIDHVFALFFPQVLWPRYICRSGFPIFTFFIAEGCIYTRNKAKRFIIIFVLATLFQIVYSGVVFGFKEIGNLNILLTFSVSIPLIYLLQAFKKNLFRNNLIAISFLVAFILGCVGSWFLCKEFCFCYGYFGILLPVFTALVDLRGTAFSDRIKKLIDNHLTKLICTAIGLALLPLTVPFFGAWQLMGLLGILPLCFYSGEKGKGNLKYVFYVFYPLHFVVLYLIQFIIF